MIATVVGGGRNAFARHHHFDPSPSGSATPTPEPTPPPGEMNLHFGGYELVNGTTRLDINGLGQLNSDDSGNLNGAETFTAVNPTLPAGATPEAVCNGTVTGMITAPSGNFASSTGLFAISLTYTPATGAAASCIGSTATLQCTRMLTHWGNVNDLDSGTFNCVVTSLTAASGSSSTINAASMRATIRSLGENNNGEGDNGQGQDD
jgi:hypothetical protein